jgi:chitodextrinase
MGVKRIVRYPESLSLATLVATVVVVLAAGTGAAANPPITIGSSSSSMALQHPAQDKIAYLHDGSLLTGYFDGNRSVVDLVRNPASGSAVTQQVLTISGDEVTLYTQQEPSSTDIWILVGAELVGSAPLEQVQHGTYDGSTFRWNAATPIPGTISPGRQDPSITWTGKWLIATWWDDTQGSDSDNVFMNWTTDITGQSGWQSSATLMTITNENITQPNIRHSAKLGATVLVYGTHYRDLYRVLLDSQSSPSLGNWTAEARVDPGYDDSEAGFGGPQVAIDESTGKIHVFRAVMNAGGPDWHGVTYWLGTPDSVPMVTGTISWNPRLLIDSASSTDPVDIAGAVDAAGKVYVFWVTGAAGGSLKYASLVSPYTAASSVTTFNALGSNPRYPHVPAQAPLSRGYIPLLYQYGSGPYNIVLDTSLAAAGGDTVPPSTPSGLNATASTTQARVTLTWNASTDNVGVTGYTIYRNGSALATVSGSTQTYNDDSVASLATYSYTVDAFDAAGNHSAQSTAAIVTTPDTTPPSVPTGLTANPVSSGEIDLGWNASSDNVGVTGYTVYRNGSLLTTVAASPTSFADMTVGPSTTYTYTVGAFDAAGNHSAQSSGVTVTTPGAPDTQPPTVPTGVAAKAGAVGEVDVSWLASTDNVAVTGYTVYRDGVALGTVSGATLTYADKTALGSTTYSYTVDAFDAAANHSSQSLPATITTPDWSPPTTPTGLTATVINNGEIDLSWSASTDNVGVTGYTVYRNGAAIGTTGGATLTYADTTVGHGFTYSYTVDAFDAAGNHSPRSAPASATTVDDIAPTTPGAFKASAASATSVSMSWSASTDNVGVAGYDVYRDSAALVQVGASTLTYTDTVAAGSTHAYTVDAVDAAGNHSPTAAPVTVTTPTVVITPSYVQGAVRTTGGRVTSMTVSLGPVAKGDLLVGLFGQYDSTGVVGVKDNVNGAWTRSASTTWRGGTSTNPGDIALYYFANAAAAPGGLTITVTATNPTYLQASAGEYSGVATTNPLDQVVIANGSSTSADSGATPAVVSGELVFGALVATNGPGNLTSGSSQGVAFVKRGQSTSGTQGEEDVVSSAAGQQHAGFTFATSVPWFMVCAVFRHA